MAKKENFYLETRGGALILQETAKNMVHGAAQRIADQATRLSGASTGHKANLNVIGAVENLGGKANSARYVATIVANDTETEAQMRRGGYIAKAKDAGRIS